MPLGTMTTEAPQRSRELFHQIFANPVSERFFFITLRSRSKYPAKRFSPAKDLL
jgi:hypothetical protein